MINAGEKVAKIEQELRSHGNHQMNCFRNGVEVMETEFTPRKGTESGISSPVLKRPRLQLCFDGVEKEKSSTKKQVKIKSKGPVSRYIN